MSKLDKMIMLSDHEIKELQANKKECTKIGIKLYKEILKLKQLKKSEIELDV